MGNLGPQKKLFWAPSVGEGAPHGRSESQAYAVQSHYKADPDKSLLLGVWTDLENIKWEKNINKEIGEDGGSLGDGDEEYVSLSRLIRDRGGWHRCLHWAASFCHS